MLSSMLVHSLVLTSLITQGQGVLIQSYSCTAVVMQFVHFLVFPSDNRIPTIPPEKFSGGSFHAFANAQQLLLWLLVNAD